VQCRHTLLHEQSWLIKSAQGQATEFAVSESRPKPAAESKADPHTGNVAATAVITMAARQAGGKRLN